MSLLHSLHQPPLVRVRLALLFAALAVLCPMCAVAEVVVYDYKETVVSIGGGYTDPVTYSGVWIFDTKSSKVVEIGLWSYLKEYSVRNHDEAILRLTSPGGRKHFVIGYSYSSQASETDPYSSSSFSLLRGPAGPPDSTGEYPAGSWPSRLAGPTFFFFENTAEQGNAWLEHGTHSLTLNRKWTKYHNAKNNSVDTAVAEILKAYEQKGYKNDSTP